MYKIKIIEGDLFHSGVNNSSERAESLTNHFLSANNVTLISSSYTISDYAIQDGTRHQSWSVVISYKENN